MVGIIIFGLAGLAMLALGMFLFCALVAGRMADEAFDEAMRIELEEASMDEDEMDDYLESLR